MTEPLDWARVDRAALADPDLKDRVRQWGRMNRRDGRHVTSRVDGHDVVFEAWQERSLTLASPFDDMDTQLASLIRRSSPWRFPSIRAALSVPAIFGAVTLVSNLVGSMSMRALKGEVELPPDKRPRVIIRPDPFTIPREFYRGTTYNLASRGEADWWIARRDGDDQALSIINMPPHEVTIEENPRDLRFPIVHWRDRLIPNDDFRQLVWAREPGELRGVGPLQMCGAAISVAVEAQEWAANFFGEGGHPSVLIKTANELDPTLDASGNSEADILRNQWIDRPNNVPRVIDPGIESVTEMGVNQQGGQMLLSRDYQVGEVARMFHIPDSLLSYAVAGSSLTYQNVGQEFDKLRRQCLQPDYMEPIEQTMTDLLTRSIVARFNADTLTLADIKTRYEVYGMGIESGIIDSEEARRFEGLAPGDVENAAVPFAPPAAIPAATQLRSGPIRCDGSVVRQGIRKRCNKLLAEAGGFVGTCPRCHKPHMAAIPEPPAGMAGLRESVDALLAMRSEPVVIAEGAVQVTVNIPDQPAPVVNIAAPEPPPLARVTRIEHDDDGVMVIRSEAS